MLSIADVIGLDIPLTLYQSRFVGNCPFCGKLGSLTVFPDSQSFHCTGCESGGDVFNYLMQRHSISFRDALQGLVLEFAGKG